MKNLDKKLKAKGWSEEEIRYSLGVLATSHHKKTKRVLLVEKIVFWVLLLLVICGTLATSTVLMLFLFFAKVQYLYIIVAGIALAWGWVVMKIIQELDEIENVTKILPGLFLPALALINVYVIVRLANMIALGFQYKEGVHSSVLISLVYVVAFMIPYSVHVYRSSRPKPL